MATGLRLAAISIRRLPGATAIALVLVYALGAGSRLGSDDNGLADLLIRLSFELAEAVVLAPYAVLIHRLIILGEDDSGYWRAARSQRSLRFAAAALIVALSFDLLTTLPGIILVISPVSRAAPLGTVLAALFIGLAICWSLGLRVFTGALLAFPAIATDASRTPVADSFRMTRGSMWRLVFIWTATVIPVLSWEISILWVRLNIDEDLWPLVYAGWASIETFTCAWLVAVASHLFLTRHEWSSVPGPASPMQGE